MKSGPALKGWTRRPRFRKAAMSVSATVVLPTPLCVPAIINLGERFVINYSGKS
jgi:hypothetical protein